MNFRAPNLPTTAKKEQSCRSSFLSRRWESSIRSMSQKAPQSNPCVPGAYRIVGIVIVMPLAAIVPVTCPKFYEIFPERAKVRRVA